MAKRKRHASTEVAIGELLVIGDIRAADACCPDSNLQLANARFLDAPLFLDADAC